MTSNYRVPNEICVFFSPQPVIHREQRKPYGDNIPSRILKLFLTILFKFKFKHQQCSITDILMFNWKWVASAILLAL